MARILLDTSVIIDALNGHRGRAGFLEDLLEAGNTLACCPVNVTEVYAGMRPNEANVTEEFLGSLEFIPLSWAAAKKAGLLKRDHAKKGITLNLGDATIAAVAIENDLTLLTDNTKHFPMKEISLGSLPKAGSSKQT
jgi:predicted nucleic acid-binding protein